MQAHEQNGESIHQTVSRVGAEIAREECAVGQRVTQMLRNKNGFEWFTLLVAAPGYYADWFDAGDVEFAQLAECFVFVFGCAARDFLHGENVVSHLHEAHDVSRNTAR